MKIDPEKLNQKRSRNKMKAEGVLEDESSNDSGSVKQSLLEGKKEETSKIKFSRNNRQKKEKPKIDDEYEENSNDSEPKNKNEKRLVQTKEKIRTDGEEDESSNESQSLKLSSADSKRTMRRSIRSNLFLKNKKNLTHNDNKEHNSSASLLFFKLILKN